MSESKWICDRCKCTYDYLLDVCPDCGEYDATLDTQLIVGTRGERPTQAKEGEG